MKEDAHINRKLIGRVAQKGRNKNYIVIQEITSTDKMAAPYIDVRSFYSGADGQLYPTSRGIRIHKNIAVDVGAMILKSMSHEDAERCVQKWRMDE